MQSDREYVDSLNVPLDLVVSRCLTKVILAQYKLVNGYLMSLLLDLGIQDHLAALRRYLLMDAGDFADQLSGRLFEIVS